MTIKAAILKIIGWVFAFIGIFLLIIGIGMTIDSDSPHSSDGPPVALCSLIFLAPAGISLYLGRKISREHDLINTLSVMVQSYGRITVADLSLKLSVPPARIVHALSKAVTGGMINGSFDRTTDEFVASGADANQRTITHCPRCGAALDSVYLKSDTVKCRQCGSII